MNTHERCSMNTHERHVCFILVVRQKLSMEHDLLCSRIVKASDRRYFFDVYEKPSGVLFTIKESRMKEGRPVSQALNVWEGALPEFVITFLECLQNAGSETLLQKIRERLVGKCQEEEKTEFPPVELVDMWGEHRGFF